MILKYIIKKEDVENKSNLKDYLKNKLYMSKRLILQLKLNNKIFVNSKNVNISYILKDNDVLIIDLDIYEKENENENQNEKENDKSTFKYKPYDYDLNILYEDDYLLIINKPYNMPVHPSLNNSTTTLYNAILNYYIKKNIYFSKIHIVTRLDKDTSGICVIAKHKYIQELFIRKKDEIDIKKTYIAVVNGVLKNSHGIIEKNIGRKNDSIILREIKENTEGDFAKTEYFLEKVNSKNNYSIARILLHTGRTHQIRVHMSYIGHPLLGDDLYYNEYLNKLSSENKNLDLNNIDIFKYIKRQALHSYNIQFNHPITNVHLNITADLFEDMKRLM